MHHLSNIELDNINPNKLNSIYITQPGTPKEGTINKEEVERSLEYEFHNTNQRYTLRLPTGSMRIITIHKDSAHKYIIDIEEGSNTILSLTFRSTTQSGYVSIPRTILAQVVHVVWFPGIETPIDVADFAVMRRNIISRNKAKILLTPIHHRISSIFGCYNITVFLSKPYHQHLASKYKELFEYLTWKTSRWSEEIVVPTSRRTRCVYDYLIRVLNKILYYCVDCYI